MKDLFNLNFFKFLEKNEEIELDYIEEDNLENYLTLLNLPNNQEKSSLELRSFNADLLQIIKKKLLFY